MTTRARLFPALAALILAGCGPSFATVTGTVTGVKGPIETCSIGIQGEDGTPHMGAILPDGSFRVEEVPFGPVKVTLNPPYTPDGAGMGDPGKFAQEKPKAGPKVVVPAAYTQPGTTPWSETIVSATQTLNLVVK